MKIKKSYIKYLTKLINDTNKLREETVFEYIEDENAQITYSKNPKDVLSCKFDGIFNDYLVQENSIIEKENLRVGTKNYFKFYRSDGKIKKIEAYINGRIDNTFIAKYEKNKRFLIPFIQDSKSINPCVDIFVTVYKKGEVVENYAVSSNHIVHIDIEKKSDTEYNYSYISYVLTGIHPVLQYWEGKFIITDKIESSIHNQYDWTMENTK